MFSLSQAIIIGLAGLLPLSAAESAGQQFHLSTLISGSKCFLDCHSDVTSSVNLPGRNTNFYGAVTLNCEFDQWNTLMTECLVDACISAPDIAYAVQYGRDFCRRGGVPGVDFILPSWFLESEGGAYYNASMTSSSLASRTVTWALPVAIAIGTSCLVV